MTTISGYALPVDGEIALVDIDRDDLAALQKLVDGYFEIVHLPALNGAAVLLVNEDGLPLGLPYNVAASVLAGRRIVGPAALVGSNRGEFVDCPVDLLGDVTE